MGERPLILVANDDGIHSEGLTAMADALAPLGEVVIAAPDREQSAASHALTLHRPLRANVRGPGKWAIDGTPTDCINLAVNGILGRKPTLVMSGMNWGANLGDDVTYSGTVSAAMEGTLLGIPSVAVSLVGRQEDYRIGESAAFAARLAAWVLEHGLPADTLLNVNIPPLPAGAVVRGIALTRMGRRRYGDAVVEKVDPRGRTYYWIGGAELDLVAEEGTDFHAITQGFVSITPIHLDLTNYRSFDVLKGLNVPWS